MAKLVQDEAGQIFVDEGGGVLRPVTEDQAGAFSRGENPLVGGAMSANEGLKSLASGLLSFVDDDYKQVNQESRQKAEALALANPLTAPVAEAAPQIAIGAASMGAGLPGAMAIDATLGAGMSPEAPLQGAALGALLGGVGELAPGATSMLYGRAKQGLGKVGIGKAGSTLDESVIPGYVRPGDRMPAGAEPTPGSGAAASPSPPSVSSSPLEGPPPRMAERVAQQLELADAPRVQAMAEAGGDTRAFGGLISPEGLESQYGVRVTDAQRRLLTAMNTGEDLGAARQGIIDDELLASNPVIGRGRAAVRGEQAQAVNNFLARELDLPPNVAFTDATLSDTIDRVGQGIDAIADQMGTVPLGPSVRQEMADIIEQTTGAHKTQLKTIADEILAKAERNGGALNGQEWTEMRTKLNNMVDAGMRQGQIGKISDAQELLQTMTKQMEDALPAEAQAELRKLRKQYAIAANLQRAGSVSPEGTVNLRSFYGKWKQNQSKRLKGRDDVGQFLSTMDVLTSKRIGDSGTATRLLNKGTETGVRAIESIPVLGPIIGGAIR